MNGWWMYELWQHDHMQLFSWVFWVILSICLHELGHGFAAIRCGDDTPRLTGHMTLNPIVHMGPVSLIMFALVGIAWGLMPVNPSRFRRTTDEAIVAAAGPAVNLILAALCIVASILWLSFAHEAPSDPTFKNMRTLLLTGASLNIVLMLFNLVPVPPLDGSRIVATFVRPYREFLASHHGSMIGLVFFVLVFRFAGQYIFEFGGALTGMIVGIGVAILGGGHVSP